MVMAIRYLTKFDGLVSNTEDDNFQHLLRELNERNIDIEDLVEVIHQVHPRCSDMIVDCQWLVTDLCSSYYTFRNLFLILLLLTTGNQVLFPVVASYHFG
jgi:hypothetical protein